MIPHYSILSIAFVGQDAYPSRSLCIAQPKYHPPPDFIDDLEITE